MRHLTKTILLAVLVIAGISLTPSFHGSGSRTAQDAVDGSSRYVDTIDSPVVAYAGISGLELVTSAWADDAGPPDAGAAPAPVAEPSVGELVGSGTATAGAVKAALDSKTMTGWLTALSAIFSLVILLLRKFGGKLFGNAQIVRCVALGLGLAAGLTASVAGGLSWWDALQLALSGPGALALHQSLKTVVPSKWATAKGGS